MLRFSQAHSRGPVLLVATMAVVLNACGGGSATPTPALTPTGNGATSQPSPTIQPSPTAAGPGGAAAALAARTSYRFTLIVEGGSMGDTLSMLTDESADGAVYELKGTIVNEPAKAVDVIVTGMVHVISVGGSDYVDKAVDGKLTGEFTKHDLSEPTSGSSDEPGSSASASVQRSLADSLSPLYFYSAFDFTKGFDKQESVTVSGIETDHYVANDTGQAALERLGSVAGISDASWTGELWVAKDGGYPVKMVIVGKSGPAGSETVVFQRQLTITNVDDPGNEVTAPANVTGA
jgi:hypothetical protein